MAWGNLTSRWYHKGTNVGGLVHLRVDTTSASTASTRFYEGANVVIATGGYAKLAGNGAAGDQYAGVCAKDLTWTAGEANVYVAVWTKGEFNMYFTSDQLSDIGSVMEVAEAAVAPYGPVAVAANNTAANNVSCGIVVDFGSPADTVKVKINGFALGRAGQQGVGDTA